MPTRHDLEAELSRLAAQQSPSRDAIRRELDQRRERRDKLHRNTAWVAAAAAVVLVVGGTAVTAGALNHGQGTSAASAGGADPAVGAAGGSQSAGEPTSAGKSAATVAANGEDKAQAAANPSVRAADAAGQSSEAGSPLVAHRPQSVTSPVTAQAPSGLDGREWRQAPGALAVTFFDRDALQQLRAESAANPDANASPNAVPEAGYVITSDRDGHLTTFGATDGSAPAVTRHDYPVGGHQATLDIAARGTVDQFGSPASERLTWQLPDGQWIHVWTSSDVNATPTSRSQPSPALRAFAETITDKPQSLQYDVSIGLTLSGMQNVSRINADQPPGLSGTSLLLCEDGYDPMSAAAQGDTDAPCVVVAIMRYTEKQHDMMFEGRTVKSGGLAVHVFEPAPSSAPAPAKSFAWADIDGGLTVVVNVPSSAHLSDGDFAALVASVRVSPRR